MSVLKRTREFVRRLAFLAVGSLLLPTAVQALPISVATNFTGSSRGLFNPFIPPDTDGAIGGKYFVELINGRYAVYDSSTGQVLQSKTLDGFWTSAGITTSLGTGSFDPRILFDPFAVRSGNTFSGRWFAASVDNGKNANHILVAVSDTPDPTKMWHAFAIDSDPTSQRWADFPQLGLNRDAIVVSANMFCIKSVTTCTATQTAQLVLPKMELLGGSVANRTLFTSTLDGTGDGTGGSAAPAVSLTNSQFPIALLSAFSAGTVDGVQVDFLKVSSIDGDPLNPTLNTSSDRFIPTAATDPPPDAVQKGSTALVDTGNERFSSSVISQQGDLWGVQTIAQNSHSALRWFHIDDPLGTPTVVDSGIITGDALGLTSADLYYGSIGVDSSLHAVIGFTASSSDMYPSAYAIAGRSTSRNHLEFDLAQPLLLRAGQASYEVLDGDGVNRWGDYSATVVQADNSLHFWTIQEWASAENQWSTQISEIVFGVPEPATLTLLGLGLVGLAVARRRKR